jgi:hypothetical protein
MADKFTHLFQNSPTYIFEAGFNALAQNKIHMEIFNASGSGKRVKVWFITMQKDFSTQTGVAFEVDTFFTSAVGTGGSTLTATKLNSKNDNLPTGITARHAPSGGATAGSMIRKKFLHSEETNVAAQVDEALGSIWPPNVAHHLFVQPIILNEGEGVAVKQITATTAGVYNTWAIFTTENA